jgi:hypothetical protein
MDEHIHLELNRKVFYGQTHFSTPKFLYHKNNIEVQKSLKNTMLDKTTMMRYMPLRNFIQKYKNPNLKQSLIKQIFEEFVHSIPLYLIRTLF